MKGLIVGDKANIEHLAERLKTASSLTEYQRIQCVLIRATLGSAAAEIALLLGGSPVTVRIIHSRWPREGDAIFDQPNRGGRRHQYMSIE
jgi:DNA-binding CsgD family transcriptional regulator